MVGRITENDIIRFVSDIGPVTMHILRAVVATKNPTPKDGRYHGRKVKLKSAFITIATAITAAAEMRQTGLMYKSISDPKISPHTACEKGFAGRQRADKELTEDNSCRFSLSIYWYTHYNIFKYKIQGCRLHFSVRFVNIFSYEKTPVLHYKYRNTGAVLLFHAVIFKRFR